MPEMHEVRRHDDGSIDMDFYRARGRALRRARVAQTGRAWRRGFRRHLRELAARLWPAWHPGVDRTGVAMQLASARCAGRSDGN